MLQSWKPAERPSCGHSGAAGGIVPHMPLILLNKPCRVMSQFTDERGRDTLADYVDTADVYAAGRLDYDSEGLLLLTDDGQLQSRIANPRHKLPKIYLAQVEGIADHESLRRLQQGVDVRGRKTRAQSAAVLPEPQWLWPRNPPIRYRVNVPDSWLEITVGEGRNRQVRRMCAAVGLPVLRLIRTRVGPWSLDSLVPGESRTISLPEAWRMIKACGMSP